MASAVSSGNHSSRFPRKTSRAVFERPQKPADNFLHVPQPTRLAAAHLRNGDELAASRSTPHFTFANDEEATVSAARRKKTGVACDSPTLMLAPSVTLLSPPSPLWSGASSRDLLGEGELESVVSLMGEGDGVSRSSSPGLVKNWQQMQVSLSAPPSFSNTIRRRLRSLTGSTRD